MRAGVFAKKHVLMWELRRLQIPDCPMRQNLQQKQGALQTLLLAGQPEAHIEAELRILQSEIARAQTGQTGLLFNATNGPKKLEVPVR